MVCAQVYGLQRGFICDCGGGTTLTVMDHCHGPHSHDCHTENHDDPCHGVQDHAEDDSDAVAHEAAMETLHAGQSVPAPALTPPAPMLLTLSEGLIALPRPQAIEPVGKPPPWRTAKPKRAWPSLLSHAISLRV